VKRNLLYHVYPLRNPVWKWNVNRLNDFAHVFNGRVMIAVAVDEHTVPFKEAIAEFKFPSPEFVVVPNKPGMGESNVFKPLLAEIKSTDPEEITFYAHAKGVFRAKSLPVQTENIRAWTECMYSLNLSDPDLIERALRRYAAVGCFKRVGKHGGGAWHFGGTFLWFRHSDIFSGPWSQVADAYFGVEGWIGQQIPHQRGFCLFNTRYKDMYTSLIRPEDYEGALRVADLQLEHEETATGKRD